MKKSKLRELIRKEINEVKKKVVYRKGKKVIKKDCGPGRKWNAAENRCVKITAQEKRNRSKASKKSLAKRRTKKSQSDRNRKKSLRKRK